MVGHSPRETTTSQSREHSNRIATVESGNVDALVKKLELEGLLMNIEKKMDAYGDMIKQNNDRLNTLENQTKYFVKKCYRCGDSSHLIKNCPHPR